MQAKHIQLKPFPGDTGKKVSYLRQFPSRGDDTTTLTHTCTDRPDMSHQEIGSLFTVSAKLSQERLNYNDFLATVREYTPATAVKLFGDDSMGWHTHEKVYVFANGLWMAKLKSRYYYLIIEQSEYVTKSNIEPMLRLYKLYTEFHSCNSVNKDEYKCIADRVDFLIQTNRTIEEMQKLVAVHEDAKFDDNFQQDDIANDYPFDMCLADLAIGAMPSWFEKQLTYLK